jgi:hypothetical protein
MYLQPLSWTASYQQHCCKSSSLLAHMLCTMTTTLTTKIASPAALCLQRQIVTQPLSETGTNWYNTTEANFKATLL